MYFEQECERACKLTRTLYRGSCPLVSTAYVLPANSRRDDTPLFACPPGDHSYLYGASFFRQQRDDTKRRGFAQRAVVAVGRLPCLSALRKIVSIVGRALLSVATQEDAEAAQTSIELKAPSRGGMVKKPLVPPQPGTNEATSTDLGPAASAVLQAAWDQLARWNPPRPGVRMRLPLLGQRFQVAVPVDLWLHSGIPGEALAVRAVRSALTRQNAAIARCAERTRWRATRKSKGGKGRSSEHLLLGAPAGRAST